MSGNSKGSDLPTPIREHQRGLEDRDQDVEGRAKQLKRVEDLKDRLARDRTTLLKMPEFRRVLADMIARGKIFESPMTGNSETFRKIGRQDLAKEIWADYADIDLDAAYELFKPIRRD